MLKLFLINTKLTTFRLTQLLAAILMTLMTNGCQNLLVAKGKLKGSVTIMNYNYLSPTTLSRCILEFSSGGSDRQCSLEN